MSKEHTIRIENGRMAFVYDDDLSDLVRDEDMKVCRASHVEPHPTKPGWLVDMHPSGGPVLGKNGEVDLGSHGVYSTSNNVQTLEPFETRQEALAAERRWLEKEKGL